MINRKFINFKTYNGFLAKKNEIPEDSIVFIQDRQCIWARGKEYICDGGQALIDSLIDSLSAVAFTGTYQDLIGTPIIDSQLDINSLNLVQNKKIKEALDTKADISQLSNYVKKADHIRDLGNKQNLLEAGSGISIDENVISCTLDTNVYEIVTDFPPYNPSQNKIYLVENSNGTFTQKYYLGNGQWRDGGIVTPSINLSPYQKKDEAEQQHDAIWEYLNSLDFTPYALKEETDAIRSDLNNYALTKNVENALITLQQIIDEKYVLKKDVYHPENEEFSTTDPEPIIINPEDGGEDQPGNGDNPGEGNSNNCNCDHNIPKLVTLTVAQYEQLIEEGTTTVKGNTIEFSADTYYFTYEGEPETSNWGFGDQFPVILTDNWAFGGTFPITLR